MTTSPIAQPPAECHLVATEQPNVRVETPAGVVAGDFLTLAVAVNGSDVGPFVPPSWLVEHVREIDPDGGWQVAVYSGFIPEDEEAGEYAYAQAALVVEGAVAPPAFITISAAGTGLRWATVGRFWRGVDPDEPIGNVSTWAQGEEESTAEIAVGPVTVGLRGSVLLYLVASYLPQQDEFEAGPTPELTEIQLGRTVSLPSPLEVGIWADMPEVGATDAFAQTITPHSFFGVVPTVAALLVVQPASVRGIGCP